MLPRRHLEREVAHDRTLPVPERDAVQRDRALGGELDRMRTLPDRDRHLQQADDLGQRGQALTELAEPLGEPADRIEQLDQVEDERRDRPDRDRPGPVHRPGDEEHDDQRGRLRQR